ncbi:MAG: HEAT repeat domain-containing protein [Chloroflexota bacterium]
MGERKDATPASESELLIRSLLARLSSDDGEVRQKVRRSLVVMGEVVIPHLIRRLTNRNVRVRWEAAKALGEIASPKAAPALVKALDDREFDIRWLAAEGLITMGVGGLEPLLRSLMRHSQSLWLRQGAHHILNHMTGRDSEIEHHIVAHPPRKKDFQEILMPVVVALDGPAPLVEVPLAARRALDAIRS